MSSSGHAGRKGKRLAVRAVHCEDAGNRWMLKIQVSRAKRMFEATIPRDCGPIELDAFLGQIRDTVRRKMQIGVRDDEAG